MLEQRFPNKRAFVTGAASGLGLEICERLAANGWRLVIADINTQRLYEVAKRLTNMGGTIIAAELDVTDRNAIEEMAARVEREWKGIDIIFNNAGVAGGGEFDSLPIEEWDRLMQINLWSVIYGCRAFVPMMKAQGGGYIVNTASSAGTLAAAQMANYNVTKAGVVSLSETLKVELSPYNIGVTVVCPTVFKTNLGESIKTGTSMESNLQQQLKDCKITPSDVVNATFDAIKKDRLYVMPQSDARWGWRFKRFFPGLYLRVMSYMYKHRKWIYAYVD